ncbi:uncharacterized protein LOC119612920 [Lucilia sericata]|uniref:uncharacterized protein LOC119612920 n=1 Tax=Lucilia sericata TaxID=13632 RepID=UPI0018A8271E|nr:uncharacterized protein LOC119612920 [Lucilia sericata]
MISCGFVRLLLLTLLLAHHSLADISELVQSGNGFLYDAPLTSNLPLAPLDLTNDEQTHKAFGDSTMKTALKTSVEVDIVPSVATAASLKTHFTVPLPKKLNNHSSPPHGSSSTLRSKIPLPVAVSKKSGYNYMAPLKPFFIA